MITTPIKVACVVDYYLPGFKGGGPIRTIANMRELLAGDADIAIFTRDRDLGSNRPYEGICADTWSESDHGQIFYASPKTFGARGLQRATTEREFDLLYLNSFFGYRSSIQMYVSFRRATGHLPILLAPRGEFSPKALSIKRLRKRVFLALVRLLGLYRDIQWHASTDAEGDDILRQFPAAVGRIHLAEDPVDATFNQSLDHDTPRKQPGQLRLAFISRISPMKNLDGLLRALFTVRCLVELDIFGPIEDKAYWKTCQKLIDKLPPNVVVSYDGALNSEMVSGTFADYDLFAFPTHGENFGHVIFEALRAGTPVLVSDRTPWQTDAAGAIKVVPLGDTEAWREQLEAAANMTEQQRNQLRTVTRDFAWNYARKSGSAAKNLAMFRKVVGARA
jgi:glycosyltransferase involved in cell wall biosynthesis